MILFSGKKTILLAVILISTAVISACSSPEVQEITNSDTMQLVLNEGAEDLPLPEQQMDEGSFQFESVNANELESGAEVDGISAEASPAAKQQPGVGGGSEPENLLGVQTTPPLESGLDVAPEIGAEAPNITLTTVNGEEVQLHDLRGEAVMVNYWVTWCIPCIEEMPVLEKLHREYQDQGFTLLSVNGINQDDMDTVLNTLGEFDVTFPVGLDEGDSVYNDFRVRFMPTSFFIDQYGVIQHIQLGSTTEEGFRARIEELLSDQL